MVNEITEIIDIKKCYHSIKKKIILKYISTNQQTMLWLIETSVANAKGKKE